MQKELAKAYDPKETEDKWYARWEKSGSFNAEAKAGRRPYSIVIPPPNVTGILHMGHALNNTIQDILIRFKRMQGFEALWVPGTDHAGIATQNVVEKELAREGKRRHDLGREAFIERVWQWRAEYGSTIIRQLKKLGCSCDWRRERFTMDEGLSNAVLEVFIRLYEEGLVYRGNYIVNWCPRCHTALSDEEAEHREIDGLLYYIKYPIKDVGRLASWPVSRFQPADRQTGKQANYIVVATTRPETMLGDVAVCVNPEDERYRDYIGKTVILPIVERAIPVVADSRVDIKFGTGALKVTPAHDPVDFELARAHGLAPLDVMNPDGTMNAAAGEYAGMDRFECREALLEDLKERGFFIKSEPHKHAVGHCYRCHTVVEPRLSKQWFVRMKPLAAKGIAKVNDGTIRFYPPRWTKVYLNWMENIRDWCISRQIWWGHRIPVWYCSNCEKNKEDSVLSTPACQGRVQAGRQYSAGGKDGIIVAKEKPAKCPRCGSTELEQDPDVLDTWFSSWLWPFSTLGWPQKTPDLKYFYPTNTLVTAQEIIFFWVARMIMAGLEFMGDVPFRDVYIHGTVRDDTGRKMSKSLGNIIDPLEVIKTVGADALRFSMISITATGQDVYLSPKKFEIGRNFANKIWNASRFILMNIKEDSIAGPDGIPELREIMKGDCLTIADRWIVSRLYSALADITASLEGYRLNEAANRIYDFFWREFCDWYLELSKIYVEKRTTQVILYSVLERSLRIMHPFMPFITEELWHALPHDKGMIMLSPWPEAEEGLISGPLEAEMARMIAVITAVRNIRAEWNIDAKSEIAVIISCAGPADRKTLGDVSDYIRRLAKAGRLDIGLDLKKPKGSVAAVTGGVEVFVLLEGLIDLDKEKRRLAKKCDEIEKFLASVAVRLLDEKFLSKAPPEVIEQNKNSQREMQETLSRLRNNLTGLG